MCIRGFAALPISRLAFLLYHSHTLHLSLFLSVGRQAFHIKMSAINLNQFKLATHIKMKANFELTYNEEYPCSYIHDRCNFALRLDGAALD
jgi:hypothetical protein